MAEILVKAIDATHSNPLKDAQGCYKRGMPVAVMPDGHRWGSDEGLPKFWIIKVPDLPVEAAQQFIQAIYDMSNPEQPVMTKRREWQIDIAKVPQTALDTLEGEGVITVNKSLFVSYLKRHLF